MFLKILKSNHFILKSVCLLLIFNISFSDVKGKISGKIINQKNEPVIGVNIVLTGTTIGTVTDIDGNFVILNISPNQYNLRISGVGYTTKILKNISVNADQSTIVNEILTEQIIEGDEVIVIATRPIVDIRQTSSVAIMDSKEIKTLPVQELNDIVNLQAGVVNGHFRGGRLGEVQYQVDGVSINNPYDNSASIRIDKSIIQEVQVVSGTFDAEYGQAMSGVVNAILKSGDAEKFFYSSEIYFGQYSGDIAKYPFIKRFRPTAILNEQFSISGPTIIPNTTFLISFRNLNDEGYLFGERRFSPFDTMGTGSDLKKYPSGDNKIVSMGFFNELSGQGKISTKLSEKMQLSYQIIFNQSRQKNYSYVWRFNPDGLKEPQKNSFVHGFDFTHTISNSLFYNLSFRENYFDYEDLMYEDINNPKYYEARGGSSDPNYEDAAVVQGVDLGRFIQKTDIYLLKSNLNWQINSIHFLKFGAEIQTAKIEFGAPGYFNIGTGGNISPITQDTLNAAVVTTQPNWLSLYVQDKVELPYLTIRGGFRTEIFDANTTIPGNLANPVNAIPNAPTSSPKNTKIKYSLAPRLGISYPLTDKSALFFSYGHFYQYPSLGNLFSNSNYNVLRYLQEGGISYGVMGNPDLNPEKTIQYEFGYKGTITENFGLDVSLFFKDIRDLLGVEFVSTYTSAEYARFSNIDFGNVTGTTFAVDYRSDLFSISIDYTFQLALGNSSDPRETANRAAAGEDPRPRVIPLSWDQRHTLNFITGMNKENDYSLTLITKLQSGQPYTPEITPGFNGEIESNSGTKSSSIISDFRGEKYFKIGEKEFSTFLRITNLFGAHFSNGFVFANTGSVDYSLNPYIVRTVLADPSRYLSPRKIEFGISLSGVIN